MKPAPSHARRALRGLAIATTLAVSASEVRASAPALQDEPAEAEALDERLDRLEAENARLREELDILAGEVERFELRDLMPEVGESRYGLGPAASKVYAREQGFSVGGYGEALYESYAGDERTNQIDFLRAVFYAGYKFDDRWVFNSEIEIEHAKSGDGEEGEVALEFAYLDYLGSPHANGRAGLVLLPVGFLNELHEPTTFLEPSRPLTEREILPSTWREIGAGVFGDAGGFSYRAYVVNGLDASGFSADQGLRGGRQNGSVAAAEDAAVVGRLDWESDGGLLIGGSAYHGDSAQGDEALGDATTSIFEAHAQYRWRGLELRALAALANVDDVEQLNAGLGLGGSESIGEEMRGAYVSLGYDLMPLFDAQSAQSLTPFVRWETIDTQAEVPDGVVADPANDEEVLTFGLNYKPIDQIVFKAAYQDYDQDDDRLQLLLGYVL